MTSQHLPSTQKLEALQLLRGIAAALVVYVHAFDTYKEKVNPAVHLELPIGLGELGVKIFFCISGFIIFESTKNLPQGKVPFEFFLKRRLIRILPLYWIATLIYATKLSLTGVPPSPREIILSLAFIPYPNDQGMMRPIIGAGWTLNFEMAFYLVTATAILFPKLVRTPAIVITIASLALLEGTIPQGSGFWSDALSLIASNYLIFFLIGMFCSVLGRTGLALKMRSSSTLALVSPAILVTAFLISAITFGLSAQFRQPLLIAFCMACVLASISHRSPSSVDEESHCSRHLRKVSTAIGDGSYSTYLTHGFIMGPCARIFDALHMDVPPTLFSICMVVLCTAAGTAIYKNVEKPIQNHLTRRLAPHGALRAATR